MEPLQRRLAAVSDDLGPTEITDPVDWVRRWILADKEAAELAARTAPGMWLHNHDDAPGIIYTEGPGGRELLRADEDLRPVTEHLVRHDAQDVIARCEAALAILDEHGPDGTIAPLSCQACSCEGALVGTDCFAAVDYPCRTVRLLISGYRHRPGWREGWGA